ncbi:MAG: hypothetical protein PHS14_07900, partial [Elusimicrobia bacterium]|nr:hypothetical protein [Elusimicrobiota bacterium]
MKKTLPPDSLVEILGRHFLLGRSTAHLPGRHGIIHGKEYRAALSRIPAKAGPEKRAERGRLLRMLGEPALAAVELDAAIAAAPGLAAAYAWRWELRAGAGPAPSADLER